MAQKAAPLSQSPLVAFGGFKDGYNNVLRGERLPPTALTAAWNVDVTNSASVRRRPGFSQVFAQPAHSVWSCIHGVYFVANSGEMFRIVDGAVVQLATGLRNEPVSWVQLNNDVYWSNGVQRGMLRNGVIPARWGIELPSGSFGLVGGTGTLKAGVYQVRLVFVRGNGEESGASPVQQITLGANNAVRVTNLPISNDPEVIKVRVYMTRWDGAEFFSVAEAANGALAVDVLSASYDTQTLKTAFKSPPPNAHIITSFKGRAVCVAYGTLYFSDPFSYSLFEAHKNFITLNGKVTLCASMDGGLYVSDNDGLKFLSGDTPDALTVRNLSSRRAVTGTAVIAPTSDTGADGGGMVMMVTTDSGVVKGDAQGNIQDLTTQKFTIPQGSEGAAMLRKQDGVTQYVVSVQADPQVADGMSFKSQDFAEIELVSRSGVPV